MVGPPSRRRWKRCSRISKSRVWGVCRRNHWTDSKLSVHALLLLSGSAVDSDRLASTPRATRGLGVDFLLERLRGAGSLVVYANGGQRVLTQRSPEQEELFVALNLRPWRASWVIQCSISEVLAGKDLTPF